jgi:hypothetical protein
MPKKQKGKEPLIDKELHAKARKAIKKIPLSIYDIPYTGVVPDNGLHCICKGMVTDPECIVHRLIKANYPQLAW